ncbi:DUF1820 family protein [Marinobacter sp. JSM 1782161]|uniref:DUF1820 family protein n=1 Tax=Marinobacter sp. JSM 1782161 TaxID=2685906 RepID=UPI001401BCC5|nr:DUF1820 family protein [Marinobacter sp. JSM 1782161]
MVAKKCYKIIFYNQDDVFEIYAGHVYPSEMFGFLEVEALTFGERSQVVVDPSQEKLRGEFEGVQRTYIPMNAIVRIDEMEPNEAERPMGRVKSPVTPFPGNPGQNRNKD